MTYNIIVWLPILAAVGAVVMFVYSHRFPRVPETRYFQFLIFIIGALCVLQAVDVSLTDMDTKVLLAQIKVLFAPFICVTLFCLMVTHAGRGAWVTPLHFSLLCVIPLVTIMMAQTGGMHDLFLFDPALPEDDPGRLRFETGAWFWVYMSYNFGLMIASIVMVLDSMRGASRLYRKRSAVLLLALIPPVTIDLIENFRLVSPLGADLIPLGFMVSGAVIAWGLYRYHILDVRPMARGEVVERLTDAYLVVAPDGKIVDYNRTAEDLIVHQGRDPIGTSITEMLPFGDELMAIIARGEAKGDVAVHGERTRYYEAVVMPVTIKDEALANVVLLRDITERKDMEEELRTANHRLGLMSVITRHDLQNKLTAINGYSSLTRCTKDPEKVDRFLTRLEQESSSASELIKVTRELEVLGFNPPSWCSVDDLFHRAADLIPQEGIDLRSDVGTISVLADHMIDKVFYNLMDNSLRHGNGVTSIALERQEDDQGLVIVYSDDGVGVPPEDKERIFERGFGSNTGLGMYLIREILGINGISIEENGRKGARFEMRVPPGRYRVDA